MNKPEKYKSIQQDNPLQEEGDPVSLDHGRRNISRLMFVYLRKKGVSSVSAENIINLLVDVMDTIAENKKDFYEVDSALVRMYFQRYLNRRNIQKDITITEV